MDAQEPATTRAYLQLERMIVTLELPPGSVTTEGALVERLALGRTPVREAIQRLGWEGLLDVRPRAGLAIAPLHAADWRRVLDARRGVEVILARAAARFATDEAAARFHAALTDMQKAVITGNVVAFLEADKSLDEAIAATADNPFAARLAAPLQTHSRRFWYRYQADTGLAGAAEGHVALIRSMIQGDEAGAGAAAGRLMDLLSANADAAARA
jgi:DNA-binding GntR family transcriptional regulator